ncbi:hypothetical protein Rsub_06966 [Raphidocelis subcapitata]|uniref:Uncharacterized protein n=1 Tax=Raphidocelis subcapitata TaxID=307507 RepID=A0A2V0P399_9CHLO|nr:hypothetical protein Rsub_06966 [Raphidocelis subcapitata]|eukprot:GBF94344.1 hypothetical protein Rsub_06966 [Raphidocelis subcapitata]
MRSAAQRPQGPSARGVVAPRAPRTRLPGGAPLPAPRNGRAARRAPPALPAVPSGVEALLAAAMSPHPGLAAGAAANSAVFAAGIQVLLKGLTWEGVANSWLLGTLVYSAFGLGGYLLVCLYFIFGTLVTKVKLEQKQKEGIAEARSGRRSAGSVWGSGSAGAACAALALATGNYWLWGVGFVASFTSKLSDTVSSEIGKAYGKTTYLITTLQRVPRGTEGAVSAEGTAAGAAAALFFSFVALAVGQVDPQGAAVAAAAAVAANLFESWLGAAVQGRVGWLTNDVVNAVQITVAAGLAVALTYALTPLG